MYWRDKDGKVHYSANGVSKQPLLNSEKPKKESKKSKK